MTVNDESCVDVFARQLTGVIAHPDGSTWQTLFRDAVQEVINEHVTAELQTEVDQLRSLLRRMERASMVSNDNDCVICKQAPPDHADDCELWAAIR